MSEEGGGLYRPGVAKERILTEAQERAETDRDPWKHRSKGMRCRTCRFYVQKVPDTAAVAVAAALAEIGRCRRSAPTMAGFPVVFPHDWCGEHKLDENRV